MNDIDNTEFNKLKIEVENCRKCKLSESRNKVVFGNGDPDSKIFMIGEGPGYDEDKTGKVFVGRSGQLLDKIFLACGFDRNEHIFIGNIVKCRPPQNRTPSIEEQRECLPYLEKALELQPDDRSTMISLKEIYTRLKMYDELKVIDAKLEDQE